MTENELFNTPHAKAQAEKKKKKALETAATVKPSKEVWAVINGLEIFTPETIAILTQRGQEWHDKWPIGEPHYSRNDGYQFVIHANQVAILCKCSIRHAQELLKETRKFIGKDDDVYVSVKEFCSMYKHDEEDFRRALRDIEPDFSIRSRED